jgi:hypothetical protein
MLMDDNRVWSFEEGLWTGDAAHYRELIDDECLMVLPAEPFVMTGEASIEAVSNTPRWSHVDISQRQIARPQEGLIVIAYLAKAKRDKGDGYEAYCTSTYRRLSHDKWRVVQHHQMPRPIAPATS